MAMEEDKELDDNKAVNAAIRSAKKSNRPQKIGIPERRESKSSKKISKPSPRKARTGGAFESDLGRKPKAREGIRSRKDDAVKLGKKGGSKGKKGGRR